MVAAPYNNANSEESLAEFAPPPSLEKMAKQCKKIVLIQSKDDPVVPLEEVEKYKKLLPKAETILFENRGHFKQETFPELAELIKSL